MQETKNLKVLALANKQYTSIIRLFKHADIPLDTDFNLPRSKKVLQAEFNLSENGLIEIDGYTYSRNDVFDEIALPDFSQRLIFHKNIWEKPALLQWLETNKAGTHLVYEELKTFLRTAAFNSFLSPYFQGPFIYLSRTLLQSDQLSEMGLLLRFHSFLQPGELEEAYRSLHQYLDKNIRLLRNVTLQNYKLMRPQIAQWIDHDWMDFLNDLPEEFYNEKMELVSLLINLTVTLQKKHRKDCKRISYQLVGLQQLPEEISSLIISNHNVYDKSRTFSGGGWWGVWVIFILIRIVSSNSCNDKEITPIEYHYNNPPVFKDNSQPMISDSIIKRLQTLNKDTSAN